MSINNNGNIKPAYSFFLHVSDLDYNSKKGLNAFQLENNYKSVVNFDIKNENINDIDFSSSNSNLFLNNKQFKNNNIINKNIFNLNHGQSINKNQNQNQSINNNKSNSRSMNNINTINNDHLRQQNKQILAKKKPKKKRQPRKKNPKNAKKSRNTSYNADFSLISKKNKQRSKASQISVSSDNSTKRNNLLRTHNSPEKYPDDYWSIDSFSDEEKELRKKEMQINQNSNSLFFKEILENGKLLNEDYIPKKDIELKLEGFDLMSVDLKSMFRDNNFKKKYYNNFKIDIKIVYFDKDAFPLHAIFIFADKKYVTKKDKTLFPGAFKKEYFIEFCEKMIIESKKVKVELLMDYAEMYNYQDLDCDINMNLFYDFYFLVDILDDE